MAKPKIFVSHSTKDNAFASKLVNDLKAAGADAWMDANDLGAGNFQQRISEALANCEWFLLMLTRNALVSDWVRMEVDAAIRLKHQKRIKELIFIKAGEVDHQELPALWGVFNIFDATANYDAAVVKTLREVRLSFVKTNPPLESTNTLHSKDQQTSTMDKSAASIPTAMAHVTQAAAPTQPLQVSAPVAAHPASAQRVQVTQAAPEEREPLPWIANPAPFPVSTAASLEGKKTIPVDESQFSPAVRTFLAYLRGQGVKNDELLAQMLAKGEDWVLLTARRLN